ncbi:TPA: hypothetical protein DCQ44_02100 [Candidatus Taylorbacteria bacterium]|nr:hypothetical protein [Candidatus Taylorbacteria bacterium]
MKRQNGFTLIELLVVISIIALLSTIIFAALNSAKTKAQATVIRANFDQLQKAILLYQNSDPRLRVIDQMFVDSVGNCNPGECGTEVDDKNGSSDFYSSDLGIGLLVQGHYISQIAKNPFWPNNGSNFYFKYNTDQPASYTKGWNASKGYFACGSKPFGNYALLVYDTNDPPIYGDKLGMDKTTFYKNVGTKDSPNFVPQSTEPGNDYYTGSYCVTDAP